LRPQVPNGALIESRGTDDGLDLRPHSADIAWAAGSNPAATLFLANPNVVWRNILKIPTAGKRAARRRCAAR
jgi:hypothetical protein